LTAQTGTTHIGPIHTLPNDFENGMSSHGDPAVAFRPPPGPRGSSWANGSGLYYANLAFPLTGETPFRADGTTSFRILVTVGESSGVPAALMLLGCFCRVAA
jgi:hypothetical protein